MPSNAEVKYAHLPPIVDSPQVDANTGRPRTPNHLNGGMSLLQRKLNKKDPRAVFTSIEIRSDIGNFHKVSYCYHVPREVLYHSGGPDLGVMASRFSRRSELQHDGAPHTASIQWPQHRAGWKIFKHLEGESPSEFVALELPRRPPTNTFGRVVSKFGRSTQGYYAERFPNHETWQPSTIAIHERGPKLFKIQPQTTLEYKIFDAIQAAHIEHQTMPTEYQERFLARKPVSHNFFMPSHKLSSLH